MAGLYSTDLPAIKPGLAVPVTLTAHPDEPCYYLLEATGWNRERTARRRFRRFTVIRNDRPAYFYLDMGPGSDDDQDFQIIGCDEDSVGELNELADYMQENDWTEEVRINVAGESNLIETFLNQYEEAAKILASRSHYGPTTRNQRTR